MKFTLTTVVPNTMSVMFFVNGELSKPQPKKNSHPNRFSIAYEVAEKDIVDVHIKAYHEIATPLWFLRFFLLWFLGLFGIFSPRYDRQYLNIDITHKFKLDPELESSAIINVATIAKGGNVKLNIKTTGCELITENTETYEFDKALEKRAGRIRFLSHFMRFIGITALLFIIVAWQGGLF